MQASGAGSWVATYFRKVAWIKRIFLQDDVDRLLLVACIYLLAGKL